MAVRSDLPSVLIPMESCDRCGVRAKVRIVLDAGGELYFCQHHTQEHQDALGRVGTSMAKIPQ